ncbi:MAG: Phosphoglycerate mutase [Deltaproteobacteria bacterium]|jgi:broad specificity phosphatase PhoE|nr:Phosphoglycerate mutase [Deltaproteobacteria bacterium]
MTKLYLVRHGQTAWNVGEIFRGRADIPLDETGRREAGLAGEALREATIHAVYSSPLSRSFETAQLIAKFHNLPVEPLEAIIDISYGDWEGLSNERVRESYPELHKLWHEQPHKVCFPRGESLDEVRARTMTAVSRLMVKHEDRTIVLVAHRVPNKVICCALIGLDNSHFWRIQQDTACTNLFTHKNGEWIVSFLNDTSYLKVLKKPALKDF